MARLSRYLLGLFSSEAIALFGVAAFLLFLTQCLTLFELVSDKGQSLFTLIGQAALGMPALGILFLYVCLGIGLGRALRNLSLSSELQIIHVHGLVRGLMRGVLLYALLGAVAVMALSHIVDPLAVRATNQWATSIAGDLVSRSMIPHKFTEVVSDVSMQIGARDAEGNITDFFADDVRDESTRRTYFAKSAIITRDDKGYVLRLRDGAMQLMTQENRLSEISFARYDLALDQLTAPQEAADSMAQTTSLELVRDALSAGKWDADTVSALARRSNEGLRVLAICVFVAALAAFPSGKRRRFQVPIEISVIIAVFLERGISSYVHGPGLLADTKGSVLLLGYGLLVLLMRLRPRRRVRVRAEAVPA